MSGTMNLMRSRGAEVGDEISRFGQLYQARRSRARRSRRVGKEIKAKTARTAQIVWLGALEWSVRAQPSRPPFNGNGMKSDPYPSAPSARGTGKQYVFRRKST